MIRLYNTQTQKQEPFVPAVEGQVSMYVCGPTVYNDPHIGNARPMVVFDTLKNVFEANGLDVLYVSNYTDVDDKIIEAAAARGIPEKELTDEYIARYEDLRRSLNAKNPDVTPRVSQTMDEIISFIGDLVDNGSAYVRDGDVYYRVSSNPSYGELSGQNLDDLKVGARIEENDVKESPLDFVLWKKTDSGIQWDSPWSKGRPGWHTECVVMIQNVFGKPTIDIHGGGMDLRFPHHENETAQARSHNHAPLANLWMHNGMINIDSKKMSKSLGNVWLVKDLLKHYDGNAVRWLLLATHYRAPLNISSDALQGAQKEISRIENAVRKASVSLQMAGLPAEGTVIESDWDRFLDALNDDLNTPNAITCIQSQIKKLNTLCRAKTPDPQAADLLATLLKELKVLGIDIQPVTVSEEDRKVWNEWKEASSRKDFETADRLRAQLLERGIL